tara:strand:+ start:2094 stop:2585 length:492 start_codon:yes stop_codon:yes gene_type:complete
MIKKKAIKILEEQRQKVLNPNYKNNQEWIFETALYIKDFFGFNSAEYAWIAQFKWYVKTSNTDVVSKEDIHEMLGKKPKKVVLFLDNCKLILENKGLFKEPKKNIFSHKSNAVLLGTLFTIASIVFGIGFYFGTEKTNKDLIHTEIELNKLKKHEKAIISPIY